MSALNCALKSLQIVSFLCSDDWMFDSGNQQRLLQEVPTSNDFSWTLAMMAMDAMANHSSYSLSFSDGHWLLEAGLDLSS